MNVTHPQANGDSSPDGNLSIERFSNLTLLETGREKFKAMKADNINGLPTLKKSNVARKEAFRQIEESEFFPDDVISVGFPRSGNRWGYYTTSMVLSQSTEFNKQEFMERVLDMGEDIPSLLSSISRPRLLSSHLPLDMLPTSVMEKKPRIIYILRNPKDTIVSWYRLLHNIDVFSAFPGSWAEFFEVMLTEGMYWGSWFDHVLRSEKFIQQHPDFPPVYVLQYEKFKEEPAKVVSELCRFLGKPESLVEDIVEATQMEAMRASMKERVGKIEELFFQGKEVLHKKGLVGDWRNHFTVDQSERFDRVFEARMANSELAARVRPYIS